MVRRFNVWIELGAMFCAMLAILLSVGWQGISHLRQLDRKMQEVTSEGRADEQAIAEASRLTSLNTGMTLSIFLMDNMGGVDRSLAQRAANSKRISELISGIKARAGTKEETRLLAALEAARKPYVESYKQAVKKLVDDHQFDEVRKEMVSVTLPLLAVYHSAWNALAQYQCDDFGRAIKQGEADFMAAQRQLLFELILACVIMLFISIRVAQEVARRLRAEEKVLQLCDELDQRVRLRTAELMQTNQSLQAEMSERKRSEHELRKLSRAVEQSPVSIVITDLRGAIEYVNPKFCAVTGYSFDEVRGKNPRLLKSGEMRDECYQQMWAKITDGEEWSGEFHNRRKSGELYWESASISSIRNDLGQITHFVAAKEDITQRKRESALLVDSQQRLELATRSAQFGIWDWDLVANHKVWDAQMHVLYGIREQDYDDSFAAWQKRLHPDDRDRVTADMHNALAGRKDYNTEFRVVWPTGEVRYLEGHAIVQRAKDGSPRRMIGMNRDITKRKRAEELLRESEANFHQLSDNISDVFWITSPDLNAVHFVSAGYQLIWGRSTESYYANPHQRVETILPEEREHVLDVFATLMEDAPEVSVEYRIARPDGTIRWIHDRGFQVRDAAGNLIRLSGIASDITDRKLAESRLRKLSRAVEQSPALVVITDPQGRIEYVNPKFYAVTGYGVEEVLGKNPRLLKSGETPDEAYQQLWATIVGGEEWHGEFHNRKKNGELYWESASISPVRDEQGNVTHFVAVKEDITGRKMLEARLERQRAEHETILNSIGDGVLWLDADGFIKYENPAAAKMLGYEVAELIGQPAHTTMHHSQADGSAYPQAECPNYATLRDRAPRHVVNEVFWRKDGRSFDVEYNCTPVIDRDGRPGGTVVTFADTTERKRARAERDNLERMLAEHKVNEERSRLALEHEQKSSQIKDRFVSMVSHEFRTPLSIINTAAELLDGYLDKMTGEERFEHLKEIQGSVERMTQMMNDFLLHGNGAGNKIKCQPGWVGVESVCRKLIAEVPGTAGSPTLIKCTVEPTLDKAWLDERILRHILGNLLSNAVKYSFAGQPVELEVRRVSDSPQPNGQTNGPSEPQLEFKVSDSGIGIPAADFAKLYQTFHRAGNVGNRPGTGMGLAIVKQFVDLLGGRIRLASTEGQGTTVWVHLPAAAPTSPAQC
jgi:PAS domain S-box-containing protein